jgi:hypothetical protein
MNAAGTPYTRSSAGRLMSEKYPAAAASYEPAMSFEEIGARLGISKQQAYFYFVSALKKLRARPRSMSRLLELAELKDELRPRDLT